MVELLEKRNQYLKRIEEYNSSIENLVVEYRNGLIEELNNKVDLYRESLVYAAQQNIDDLERRIDVLDEMIAEEMPQASEIKEALINATTQKVEESIQENPIADEQNQENEKSCEDAVYTPEVACENEENIQEEVAQEQPIQEESIQEEKPEEIVVDESIANPIVNTPISDVRPGMAQVFIPTRE